MADPEPTRQETVEANIEAIIDKYGEEEYMRIISQCAQDISISLAMMIDASAS